MKNLYWKSTGTAFLAATANYWFSVLFYAFYIDFSKYNDRTPISEQALNVACFASNVFIMIPIFGGIMIDYIGVIPIIQILNIAYITGAAMLLLVYIYHQIWLVILAALFFGVSLNLAYAANYVYLCNTFITKSKGTNHFRPMLGIFLCLSYGLLAIPLLVKTHIMVKLGFGFALILGTVVLSFFLETKKPESPDHTTVGPMESIEARFSVISSPSTRSNAVFKHARPDETFLEYNERYAAEEIKAQGYIKFIKSIGARNLIRIVCLGMMVGLAHSINTGAALGEDFAGRAGYSFIIKYTACVFASPMLALINWKSQVLEKFLGSILCFYALTLLLAGIKMATALKIILFIVEHIALSGQCFAIYLYLPNIIDFQLHNMGKAIGTLWWVVCVQMFITAGVDCKEIDLNNWFYVAAVVIPAILASGTFMILILYEKWKKVDERRNSQPITI